MIIHGRLKTNTIVLVSRNELWYRIALFTLYLLHILSSVIYYMVTTGNEL
jgi:uncharacterized membrane protein